MENLPNPEELSIYARVSTKKQAKKETSINTQLEFCKKLILSKFPRINPELVPVYIDRGRTAKNFNRKEYQRWKADVEAGKRKYLFAYETDRVIRNLKFEMEFFEFLETHKIKYFSTKGTDDYATADGSLQIHVLGSVAEHARRKTSEKTIDTFNTKARKKEVFHKPPFGYKPIKRREGDRFIMKSLDIDKYAEETVKDIFNTFLKENSISKVKQLLNEKYKLNFSNARLIKMLKSKTYTGTVWFRDQTIPEAFPAYITKEQHQQITKLLERGKSRQPVWLQKAKDNIKSVNKEILINETAQKH